METRWGLGFQQETCGDGALQGGEEVAPPDVYLPPSQTGPCVIPALQVGKRKLEKRQNSDGFALSWEEEVKSLLLALMAVKIHTLGLTGSNLG